MSNVSSMANDGVSNLVTPVSYFIDHVAQLKSLKDNLNKYKSASLVGVSGMGKTQLARMYAYENKENYNLIWFFDCNLDVSIEFLKLAKILNQKFKANISEIPSLAKKEVMDYLGNQDKWLLVLDNLKIGDNKKVIDLVNWEHNGNIVFCSQDSELLPHTVKLTPFNARDTLTLAENLLENQDKGNIDFLTTTFSSYPILIVQGAQLLNQIKGLDKEEYKKKVGQSADKIKLNITLAIEALNPNTAKLLYKIALINNQSFSKQLLTVITDNPSTISDDIYQLSKFMLICNTDPDENNPVFEMHDIVAQKILEIKGDKDNKKYLEDTITKLVDSVPKSVMKGRIFRNAKTMPENFEIISRNAEKYNVSIYKIMGLNSHLVVQYVNSFDYCNAEDKINWFNENDRKGNFKLLLMNNDERTYYATLLNIIGNYYRNRCADYNKAIGYFKKSDAVFDDVKGYESYKFNVVSQLVATYSGLGRIQEAEQNVNRLEEMSNSGLIEVGDIAFIPMGKAKLSFMRGKYNEALMEINSAIEMSIINGLDSSDLFLTSSYLFRAETLNVLMEYEKAYAQAEQLFGMYKSFRKRDGIIFGRMDTQLARTELGQGKIAEAAEHVNNAITILLSDEHRNPKDAPYHEDPDLAAAYVIRGDVFFAQDNLKSAIDSYRDAQKIYFYLYKDNSKNVAHVSYLYTKGAKASCKAKDLYYFKCFGQPQVKEFGRDHPNTIAMFEYCKDYHMTNAELWQEE